MTILGSYEVAINGTPYRVVQEAYTRRFLDVVRQQGGTEDEPSEKSLNPNDLWRRSQDDFTHGEGQDIYDEPGADRRRYLESTGIDVTSKRAIKLGPSFNRIDDNSGGDEYIKAVPTLDYVYVLKEASTTMEVFGASQATSDAAAYDIVDATSDGVTLYAAVNDGGGNGGVYEYTGTTLGSKVNDLVPDLIAFVRGRLLVAEGSNLYNITDLSSPTAPSVLEEPIYPDFVWDCFGETESVIFAAGHAGDQSLVYRITIQEDGTSLTAPLVAGQLPDGEFVRAIKSYLGVVVLATTEGIRLATFSGDSLQVGQLVHAVGDVWSLEPRGNFVYYGSNGDIYVLDLARFIDNEDAVLVPSHSQHITKVSDQAVVSVFACPSGASMFTCDDYDILWLQQTGGATDVGGLFEIDRDLHPVEGTLITSEVIFGMNDTKHYLFLDVIASITNADDMILMSVIDDEGKESSAGYIEANDEKKTVYINESADTLRVKFKFRSGDTVNGSTTPVLVRWVLRALPVPNRTEQIQLPLDLRARSQGMAGSSGLEMRDVMDAYNELRALVVSGEPIVYTEFGTNYLASLENLQFGPDLDVTDDNDSWEGTAVVTLRLYEPNIYALVTPSEDTSESMFGVGMFGTGTFGEREEA